MASGDSGKPSKYKSYGSFKERTISAVSEDSLDSKPLLTNLDEDSINIIYSETDRILPLPAENGLSGNVQKRADDLDTERGLGGEVPVSKRVKKCCRETWTLENVLAKFPIVKWLPKYRCDAFQSDLIAGLTVGLTVIPQGLAYATIAGLPPQYGLYSAFMGCFVYIFMGTSKDITLGPTAIMSLMTAAFASLDDNDPTLAIFLSLVCGVVQLLMGVLQLGILVSYISYPVINAFTSAAAITIAVGQIKNLLGLKDIEREFLHMVYDTCRKLPETNIWDMVMGLVSLVAVILMKKLRQIKWNDENERDNPPSVPVIIARKLIFLVGTGANAIIVIVAAGVVAILESQDLGGKISVTGDIKPGLPSFAVPKFETTLSNNETLHIGDIFTKIGSGLGIVPLLGLVETMAIGKAFARANSYKIDPTQELLAIGVANILSAFVSSYPITGSFSRTAVNSQSGVRTPLGGLWTGALVILALAFLTPWFTYIPKSALAAVIIAAVIQMVDYHIVLVLWRANKWDLVPLFITFITSFVVGIEYGILIGIGVSLLMLLYPTARPKIKYTAHPGYLIVTPLQGLNFPGAEYLELVAMEKALSGEKPRNIVLNMEHLSDIDYTAVQSLKTLMVDCEKHGMQFIVCNGAPSIHRKLEAASIKDLKLFATLKDAADELSVGPEDGAVIVVEEEEPFMSRL